MIIDLLLDRYDGVPYDAGEFYTRVREYENDLNICYISIAMDYGSNDDVIHAIKRYLHDYGYDKAPDFMEWINSQQWINEYDLFKSNTKWDIELYGNGELTYKSALTADQITMVIEYIRELEER